MEAVEEVDVTIFTRYTKSADGTVVAMLAATKSRESLELQICIFSKHSILLQQSIQPGIQV